MEFLRSRREVSRLEAFSDAIFGFAATLLVVSLDVPMEFAALRRTLAGFVPFALTFGALVMLWSIHNAFFRRYPLEDKRTVALNSALMFVILFYVYPLKYLAAGLVTALTYRWIDPLVGPITPGDLGTMFLIYGLGWSAIFLCISLMYRHAARQCEALGLARDRAVEAQALAGHYAIFVGVGLASALVALTGVGVRFGLPGFVYALLGPSCAWHWRYRARVGARVESAPAS